MFEFLQLVVFDEIIWGNTLRAYTIAAIVFLGLILLFGLIQTIVLSRLEHLSRRTTTDIDDAVIHSIQAIRPPFYFALAFYIAVQSLVLTDFIADSLTSLLIIIGVYQVVEVSNSAFDFFIQKKMDKPEERGTRGAMATLRKLLAGLLWVLGVLFLLSNLGVNITSLVAGLGIGGVAIALAVQNILGDLFSSFAIYFDRPFQPGDFIIVGEQMGTVERIGIKTTRLRALRGEEIVISNNELTSARIQNLKQLKQRRVTFTIGATYDTPTKKLERIPEMIEKLVTNTKQLEFEYARFVEFADSSLVFEVAYYLNSGDYVEYKQLHHDLLIQVKKAFEKEAIDMAFPTRTVHLHKS